jgi:hypothetical protein
MSRARENADGARLDAPLASPAFTGTPTGITGTHITSGTLGNTVQDNITRLGTVTAGDLSNSAITYPAGHVINHYSTAFNGGTSSYGSSSNTPIEVSTNFRFSYTPILAGSKLLVWMQTTKAHNNTSTAYYGIGHEVTASNGTATASTLISQVITIGGDSGTSHKNAYFHHGYGRSGGDSYGYDAVCMLVDHSPSYTLGQKIWYTWIGFSNGDTFYVTNAGDVLFKITEIKG